MNVTTAQSELGRLDRYAVIKSLSAGTVPAVGLQHLQVGLREELMAVEEDLSRAEEGISTVRFVSGPPESGKTFFLNRARIAALEHQFIVARAELSLTRRLYSSKGEARALYRDLMTHLATSASPDGISLGSLLSQWVERVESESPAGSHGDPKEIRKRIAAKLRPLHELSHGFDFATVIGKFYEGHVTGHESLRESALRWLRAEYDNRTDAQADLGVRTIIDDRTVWDALNVFAAFARLCGFAGLFMAADELTVLTRRLKESVDRRENYDVIVDILTNCLEGRCRWMVMLFAVEDTCVEDRQRGLCSNAVLATWLAPNRFASNGQRDMSSPVIRLQTMGSDGFRQLLRNIRNIYLSGQGSASRLPDEGVDEYVRICTDKLGANYFENPREVAKDFIDLLHLVVQDPAADWKTLLSNAPAEPATGMVKYTGSHTHSYTLVGPGGLDESERWPGWYADDLADRRASGLRKKLLLGIGLPVVLLMACFAIAYLAWFNQPEETMDVDLNVKYSHVRGGLRTRLDEVGVPLKINDYFSLEFKPNEPCFTYLFEIDSEGNVKFHHGQVQTEASMDDVQIPEGSQMFPVLYPPGARTILLLGTRERVADIDNLRAQVAALSPMPALSPATLLLFDGEQIITANHPWMDIPESVSMEPDLGFLPDLRKQFPNDEFPVVRAMVFPIIPANIGNDADIFQFKKM